MFSCVSCSSLMLSLPLFLPTLPLSHSLPLSVPPSIHSVELMRSGVGKRYYGRSFEAIIGDLYYPRMFASSSGRGSGSGSGSGSSSGSGSRVSGSVSGSNFGTRKTIYQLPLFGDSADFWEAINDLTTISAAPTATGTSCSNSGSSASESDRDSNSGNDSGSDSGSASGEMGATKSVWGVGERLLSTLTTLQDAIDPLKKRARLERLLEEGGLPLLYEAMLEVSAKRVAGAMFVVLLVCEEYCSGLEAGNGKGKGNGSGDTDDKIAAGGSGIERPNDHTSDSGSVVAGSTGAAVESGAVVFHCAQGKDRTGLLAVLLTVALYGDSKETEARMVREYAASERLLPAKEAEAGAGAGAGTEVNEAVQMVSTSSSSSSASATASPSASASATQFDRDSAVVRRVFLASQTTSASASAASASATATVATATPADEDPSTTSPATTGPQPTAATSTTTTSSPRPPNQRLLNLSEVSSLQGSPPHAIVGLLARIRRRYGSVEGYLDKIGFTEEYRRRLRGCAEVATRANKGKEV